MIPRPSSPIIAIALWSWAWQSQRCEPKTSPVRHSLCTRTSTGWPSPTSPSAMPTWAAPVGDEVVDGDHAQAVAGGEAVEVAAPGHAAVLVEDLADHSGREAAGQLAQVDHRLGVAGSLEH